MAFAAYELYYCNLYDDYLADLTEDFADTYDCDEYEAELEAAMCLDAQFVIDNGIKVATIIHDPATQQVDLALLTPGASAAPDWYTAEDAANTAAEVQRVLGASPDGTLLVHEPQDPAFALRERARFDARDLGTATEMMLGDSQDQALYGAFAIEFRPNLKSDFAFPVAVFAFDPREGRLSGRMLIDDNPFAPIGFTNQQKKIVARRLENIVASRVFKDLGPQFRSEALPPVIAVDTHHAINQSLEYLREYWSLSPGA